MPAYHLGCPIWANRAWLGNLYAPGTRQADFLASYAAIFDAVEGNSTFYALPSEATVLDWRDKTPDTFRFTFKLPRAVTHDTLLEGPPEPVAHFFERMAPLGPRLGPFLVQLSASFGPARLGVLDRFLAQLPAEHRYAVEVRNLAFFGPAEAELDALLEARGAARCHFDTTPLFAAAKKDPTTIQTQSRKPRVPARDSVVAGQPFLRFIGQNDVRQSTGWLDRWAETVAGWIRSGYTPYVFMHAPDDFYAPRLARAFHHLLRRRLPDLPEHPAWPGETEEQLGLF